MYSDEPKTNNNMLPSERRSVAVLALIGMLRMFGLFSLLPVLALYASGLEDASPLLIGLAVGGYGLTQAALQIPLGALSDRLGRVPVIVGGLLIFAAGSLLAASAESVYGVIAGRLLQGAGAISATLSALIADATRPAVRTRSMAVFGIGIGTAFLLAMVIGPYIAAVLGVRALFVMGAVFAVLAIGMLIAVPAEVRQTRRAQSWDFSSAIRPELLKLDFSVFLLHAILTASFVALPFLMTGRLEIPVTDHWQIYIGAMLLSLIGTVPLILRDERQGKSSTVLTAVLLILFAELLLAFAGFSAMNVVVAMTLFFAGFNFLEAALPSRLSIVATETARGASLGVCFLVAVLRRIRRRRGGWALHCRRRSVAGIPRLRHVCLDLAGRPRADPAQIRGLEPELRLVFRRSGTKIVPPSGTPGRAITT